ncbi:M56 family metallopeptidase [Mucilaginibacter sp. dw_454]|uniref:M56 family metallopeptidase n=1 Tax=Mucilaginibacter sp. dw_454 TaxID=2720079 RepID=UPI001BD473F7|nr:M56 family metallopeptidase [Mucilaginibacter sp. dw_454]
MQNLLYNISQVLGITIIHSLWQGLIVFIVLRLFMLAFPGRSSAVKYWVGYGALVFMLGWFVVTLFKELGQYNWLSTVALKVPPLALPASMSEVAEPANKLYFGIAAYMPWLTMIYVVGVVFNTLRLTLAWNNIYRIRQNISNAGFDQTVQRLAKSLQIKKHVQAAFSEWVDVPCITGFIKPIILMPVALTTHLSLDEVEAVLLHELAHVKRHDYLLNFIQQVIGILLFFNPFARLVGNLINEERENCCDDMVVHATGSPFIYAQALLKLEENKQYQWQLALAATTKKYALLNRIERIMKTKTHTVNIRPVLITLLALTFSISSIAWLNPEIKNGKVIIKNAPAIRMVTAALTGPPVAPPVPEVPHFKHKHKLMVKNLADTSQWVNLNDTTKFMNLSDTTKHKKYKIVVEDDNGVKTEYNSVNDLPSDDKEAFYNSDQWKRQAELLAKQSEKLAKQFNSPQFKKHVEKLAKYYDSPKFKKQIEAMAKSYDSPKFKKQIEDMTKYYDSPEFQKSVEEMAKQYDSPEFKKSIEDLSKYYESPEFQKSVEDMAKGYAEIGKSFGTMGMSKVEKKAALDDLHKAQKEKEQAIKDEVKARKAEQKDLKEKVEKKEVKERPEKPEAKEQPEKVEKDDNNQPL